MYPGEQTSLRALLPAIQVLSQALQLGICSDPILLNQKGSMGLQRTQDTHFL